MNVRIDVNRRVASTHLEASNSRCGLGRPGGCADSFPATVLQHIALMANRICPLNCNQHFR